MAMLVLGRKPGEYVVINENIIVKVIKTEDGQLRMAIDAPREIPIVRGELYEQQVAERAMLKEVSIINDKLFNTPPLAKNA